MISPAKIYQKCLKKLPRNLKLEELKDLLFRQICSETRKMSFF